MTAKKTAGPDVERLREALLAERNRLEMESRELEADEVALSTAQRSEGGVSGDSEDVASDLAEIEVDAALDQSLRASLADVDAALRRIDEDAYGRCEECGEWIDPARLEAIPWARRCLACQRQADLASAEPPSPDEEEIQGALLQPEVEIPERCPSCFGVDHEMAREVDELGVPTGMLVVRCASCGRELARRPAPEGRPLPDLEEPVRLPEPFP
jgi:DnaK suppressor protein